MLQIIHAKCEYRTNPLGIDKKHPRFFWQVISDQPDVLQAGYQLQVSAQASFADPVWDTGRVASGLSIQIPYAGADLQPRTRYYWRVRIWDMGSQTSGFSTGDWFETGLMDTADWQASWMAPGQDPSGQGGCPLIRGGCVLRDGIRSARVYATAAGVYELHINGRMVGDDVLAPGWTTYMKRHQYQTYDVTEYLQPGDNALGAILAPGWYLGDMRWNKTHNYYGDEMAILFQAEITYGDGSVQVVCADDSWKTTGDGPLRMSEIYHG